MVFYLHDLQKAKIFTLTLLFFALGAFVDNSGRNTHWFFYHPLKSWLAICVTIILFENICISNQLTQYQVYHQFSLALQCTVAKGDIFELSFYICFTPPLLVLMLWEGGLQEMEYCFFYDSKFSPENCKSLLNIVHMLWFGLTINII